MAHTPPNDPIAIPNKPFPSENEMAKDKAEVLKRDRKQYGGLPDDPGDDAPVKNSKPFKNLKSP